MYLLTPVLWILVLVGLTLFNSVAEPLWLKELSTVVILVICFGGIYRFVLRHIRPPRRARRYEQSPG